MTAPVTTIIYPVSDLDRAKAVFTAVLGAPPAQDTPYYVGFEVDGQTIGLDPNGHRSGMTGPVPFIEVANVNATIDVLVSAGATISQPARDVGGGKLIATVVDGDGNPIGLMHTPPGS